MIDRKTTELFIHLAHGYVAPEWFYESIKLRVKVFMPHIVPGHRYTLETICGNVFWDGLIPFHRALAGRCMAFMVVNKLVPLVFAETGGKKTKQYQFI
jgi:hypothetical protein